MSSGGAANPSLRIEEEKKELQHPGQAVEPKFGDLGLLESES